MEDSYIVGRAGYLGAICPFCHDYISFVITDQQLWDAWCANLEAE